MKILLVHFEDDPEAGRWRTQRWDLVIDLGLGGRNSYDRWKMHFRCPVTTLQSFSEGFKDFRRIRDLLGMGRGQLTDQHGLDWWEIMSILLHGEMETTILLQRFAKTIGSGDEVHLSRAGLHAGILKCLLGEKAHVFSSAPENRKRGIGRYYRVSQRLSTDQLADVVWDKYDPGYQFRGRVARKQTPSRRAVVLIPTAYINVSKTGVAYANSFPAVNFLLVATRRSGWIENSPHNVTRARLSSYASLGGRTQEYSAIENQWQSLRSQLLEVDEFTVLDRLRYLQAFPQRLRHGLEVRDAWRNVLDREPVEAVLCPDDSNPYTRIPLLLAKSRGLPNIACHHGALDGRYVFKRVYGDTIWVKGKMEQDYLVRKCEVPIEQVEIAAPALPANWNVAENSVVQPFKPYILFLSEACDVSGGRPSEFYRDILPPLADLAIDSGRKLIVKLHPAESPSERQRFVASTLSGAQQGVTEMVTGPLNEDLLTKTWFGITILSTVAMECAIRGIPCFLCKWLEFWPYEYIEQFTRFGVGFGLNHPSDISKIPEYLKHQPNADVKANCWQPAAPGRLREFIGLQQRKLSSAG